jgi:hypothetical protein
LKGCGGKSNRGLNEGIIPACACEDWGTAWKSWVRVACIRPRFELGTAWMQITDLSVWADSLGSITLSCERCISSYRPKFAWPPYTTMYKWRRKCHVADVSSCTAIVRVCAKSVGIYEYEAMWARLQRLGHV